MINPILHAQLPQVTPPTTSKPFQNYMRPDVSDIHGKLSNTMNQTAKQQITFAQKILLQQLKNQFPGNEFDANKMVESLMNMMQIAQQSQLNETQQKNLDLNIAMINHQISHLLGKTVEYADDTFDFDGHAQTIAYTLPPALEQATVHIYKQGDTQPLYSQALSATDTQFVWEGSQNENDMPALPGTYNVMITAKDDSGHEIALEQRLHSAITHIDYSQGPLGVPYAGQKPILNFNRLVGSSSTPAVSSPIVNNILNNTGE